jgi:hypothetical protein
MAISSNDLMHATLVRRPFNRAGWCFENKLDGFRALARRDGDRVDPPRAPAARSLANIKA